MGNRIEITLESQMPNIEASFDTLVPDIEADFQLNVSNDDHNILRNRDLPDQHPMEAITGLDEKFQEESEARIEKDNDLQEQIDEISREAITHIYGGSNIEVIREGTGVTIKSVSYIFEQEIADDTWVISHNLGKRPSWVVVDSAGTVQVPDEVDYDSDNQITMRFLSSFAGKAYLN